MSEFISVIVIDNDKESLLTIKENFKNLNYVKIIAEVDNLTAGYNLILQNKPNLVIIDISSNVDWALNIIEKLTHQLKDIIIFVSSEESNLEIAVRAMRAGAREFFKRPLNSGELITALEKAREHILVQVSGVALGSIFTIFSNKGGIGKTTIATNLAVILQELSKKRVALVDLNLQLGDLSTFLDIQPSYDISYIVKNINRVDEGFLLSTMEKLEDHELYILADPPYAEQAEDISSEQINTVLTVLKSIFDYVIIDTTSSFDSKTLAALDLADRILLVSMINLPCIRNTQRCLDLFSRLNYPKEKVNILVNRYLPNEEITLEDVSDTLEHPIFWTIPNNYFTVMSAINRGIPINKIEEDANITKNFIQLAKKLSGFDFFEAKVDEKKTPEKKSMFPLLNGLFKSNKK